LYCFCFLYYICYIYFYNIQFTVFFLSVYLSENIFVKKYYSILQTRLSDCQIVNLFFLIILQSIFYNIQSVQISDKKNFCLTVRKFFLSKNSSIVQIRLSDCQITRLSDCFLILYYWLFWNSFWKQKQI